MVHNYDWATIFVMLLIINTGVWLYSFISGKVVKEREHQFSFEKAAFLTIGFLLAAVLFKWGL